MKITTFLSSITLVGAICVIGFFVGLGFLFGLAVEKGRPNSSLEKFLAPRMSVGGIYIGANLDKPWQMIAKKEWGLTDKDLFTLYWEAKKEKWQPVVFPRCAELVLPNEFPIRYCYTIKGKFLMIESQSETISISSASPVMIKGR